MPRSSEHPGEALPPELARAVELAGRRLGQLRNICWYPEVGSTNDLALAQADAGAPEGLVVLAGRQTRGRGRMGREWASPAGAGVYMSVLVRPPALSPVLTLAAGVAVAEAVEAATGLRPTLKWPNDLCVVRSVGAPRKLAGILAEGSTTASGQHALVIGIGVNVRPAAYPPGVAAVATSLEDELGREADREPLIVETLAAVWRRYCDVREGRTRAVLNAWRQRATATFGRRIEGQAAGGTVRGVITDIDETGALMVRADEGLVRLVSGEVRWIS